jgi:hypothetical protein
MRVPRIRGFGKQSRPPVEEKTSTLPVTQSPLWKRSTAGVCSVVRMRGARQVSDGAGKVIYLTGSIVLNPTLHRDYERECTGEVTPVGQGNALGNLKGTCSIFDAAEMGSFDGDCHEPIALFAH